MAHKRTDFSDLQKAQIFVRDRATCCFSGKSLWLLDYGMTPFWEIDWVDHVRPSARGGKAEISNGVCASYTFNVKKRNNGADNNYFFEAGTPTPTYFRFYGPLPKALTYQLDRFSHLEVSDWFFNRCLFNLFLGFTYRCDKKWYGQTRSRTDDYWFKAAWRRLQIHQRLVCENQTASMESRKILRKPILPDTKRLLSVRQVETENEFLRFADSLHPTYERNFGLWRSYWDAETRSAKFAVLRKVERISESDQLLFSVLRNHYENCVSMSDDSQSARS